MSASEKPKPKTLFGINSQSYNPNLESKPITMDDLRRCFERLAEKMPGESLQPVYSLAYLESIKRLKESK